MLGDKYGREKDDDDTSSKKKNSFVLQNAAADLDDDEDNVCSQDAGCWRTGLRRCEGQTPAPRDVCLLLIRCSRAATASTAAAASTPPLSPHECHTPTMAQLQP